jgi:hypothetical protein
LNNLNNLNHPWPWQQPLEGIDEELAAEDAIARQVRSDTPKEL